MPRRRCLDWPADGCELFVTQDGESRCPPCRRRRRAARNANRTPARDQVANHPQCECRETAHGHGDPCGATLDLSADHVLPSAWGHGNDGRRQTMCVPCNTAKGAGRFGPVRVYRRRR